MDTDVSLSKKSYPHCLVLVSYMSGFERDLHKQILFFQLFADFA